MSKATAATPFQVVTAVMCMPIGALLHDAVEEQDDELRGEDAQEHAKGIDGAVAYGRCIVVGGLVGIGQGGRVGGGTCDETHKGEIVHLIAPTGYHANDEDGNDGDEETCPHIGDAIAIGDGVPESGTGLDTH